MKVLVTRPLPDAGRTAAKLVRLGHEPVVEALAAYHPLPEPKIERPDAIAVTSRNAVNALRSWSQPAAWRGIPVLAVGSATAEAAREAGFADVRSGDGDGMALARLIAEHETLRRKRILYLAGEDRSPDFEDAVRAAGVAVETVAGYRMVAAGRLGASVVGSLARGEIDAILLYSARSADIFQRLGIAAGLEDALTKLRVYALSDKIAAVLKPGLMGPVTVAAAPTEDALLALLSRQPE